ncbi:Trx-2, partial [Symbiodinium microadriaticum]
MNVTTFPTFIFFRGGKEVDRIVGHDRVVEKLVRTLAAHLTDADKVCHAKRRHRIRLEKALELGLDAPPEEDVEEQGELEWTWDPESAGECMRIEKAGMLAILRDDEDDADPIQWEWSRNNRSDWKEFSSETSRELEKLYKKGKIYSDGWANTKELSIWPNDVIIATYEVSGFYANWNDGSISAYVRRRGDRCPVPHEENYLSKEQKERDERSAAWRERYEAYKKKIREEKYGNDIEAIKGTIGMLPNTGVHKWTLRWSHEPARKGVSDGIGICGDACENFGPVRSPCLGGKDDTGTSLALYANGLLYHNGAVIGQVEGYRHIEPTAEPESEEIAVTEGAKGDVVSADADSTTKSTKRKSKKKRKQREIVEIGEADAAGAVPANVKALREVPIGDRAPLFGKDSVVTCELDSGLNGGTLRFFVDKKPLENIEVTNVYSLLGASEVFPALCLCPFDSIDDSVKATVAAAVADSKDSKKKKAADVEDDADSEYDEDQDEYDEEAEICEQEEAEAGAEVQPDDDDDDDDNYPAVLLLPPDWEEEEARLKEAALAADEAARVTAAEQAAALLEAERAATKASEATANGPLEPVESVSAADIAAGCGGEEECKNPATAAADGTGISSADASSQDALLPPLMDDSGEAEAAATAGETVQEVDIPIERVRWMWESDAGWQVYSAEISREIEEAQRDGITSHIVVMGTNSHKCNLEGKVITDDADGSSRRMRRHVVGEGMAALWELLTLKYEKPMGLTGQGLLKTLEKVWGGAETMDGKQAGLGFLFLYSLLSGEARSKVIGSGYGSYGGGGYGGGGGYMMYGGKSGYSAYGKKATGTPFFTGWVDEVEPRSAVAELFQKLVPLMKQMKRKAAFHFPPPPPHVELAPPKTEYVIPSPREAIGTKYVEWDRPELSDYGCEKRSLTAVSINAVANLASSVHYRLGKDALRPCPPRAVSDVNEFQRIFYENPGRLFCVDFFATWCGPCRALVDVDECDKLAGEFQIESFPTVKFMRGGCSISNVLDEIKGGGPQFLQEFAAILH